MVSRVFSIPFLLLLLWSCEGFPFAPRHKSLVTSRLRVVSSTEPPEPRPEPDQTNPSTAFGSPISDDVKKFNKAAIGFIKALVFDKFYAGRDYARFYALETIARVPYFSYLSVLHFYETIGRWRKADYLKVHFAESWNELHHLLIMEELGGADRWLDRFVAQHVSVAYFSFCVFTYLYNPTLAYNLNQSVEEHAYKTYDQFLKDNETLLKQLPAPQVAKDYYRDGDLYMFDAMHTNGCEPRRPVINNLYDVFVAIREDEAEHVKTMAHLQTRSDLKTTDETCDVPPEAPFFASVVPSQ
eukprot:CAMPEP_0116832820 /NCGR_PEP_ID=MMETSP0418-20121206/6101_1 /TAXON_ID=1158023 /ORGANISM="Astrosyne radiata, Strain 13vi08-1A" /LENGTH=297 /DNA_ID=CAMNT_0004462217 /DNA_START=434 /DNA_END=1327 /DNA_ORIENTATION=-